jgi:hypothetical protein
MPEALSVYLKRRAEHSFHYFLREIRDVSPEDALRYRSDAWPGQRYGIGQNGSIAGIVYHTAAWKQMTLPLLQLGGVATAVEQFDTDAAPALDDWQGIAAWYKQVGMAWNADLAQLPEEAFARECLWGRHTIPLTTYITEILEHDIQHAAQIEYLKQRIVQEQESNA